MRCIIDANILIDLSQGGMLLSFFKLSLQVETPAAVLDEMIEPDRNMLVEMGVKQSDLTSEQLFEAARMNAADTRLSLGDYTAFIAARDEKIVLLTGDQRLRRQAQETGVEVRGVLWILDEIETAGLMNDHALAVSLHTMLAEGARLPSEECAQRFKRWESGK